MQKTPSEDDAAFSRFVRLIDKIQWPEDSEVRSDVARVRTRLPLLRRVLPYLDSTGWFVSAKTQRSVDGSGNPIPWYTYPAISFLSEKDLSSLQVFEFGSGGSTIWWASRAKHVVAVEHASEWFHEVAAQVPSNVQYFYEELTVDGPYSKKAATVGRLFDIIIVDGRDRVHCALNSLSALSQAGVIIWDNAERRRYARGCERLIAKGFRRLNFYGMGPISGDPTLTSIFYRDDNCLGL